LVREVVEKYTWYGGGMYKNSLIKVRRNNNNNNNTLMVRPRRSIRRVKNIDPIMGPVKIFINAFKIPTHVITPKVVRNVRLEIILTATAQSALITSAMIFNQDDIDYLAPSTPTTRYVSARYLSVKAYMDNIPATALLPALGLQLTDFTTGTPFSDRAVSGATTAVVGYKFPFYIRSRISVYPDSSSAGQLFTVSVDQPIVSGGNILVICDVLTEFQ
jgi:hypothetical protein